MAANACKGMLLRTGAGKVKRLSTDQLWVQGAIQSYAVEVVKVPRGESELKEGGWNTTPQRSVWNTGDIEQRCVNQRCAESLGKCGVA